MEGFTFLGKELKPFGREKRCWRNCSNHCSQLKFPAQQRQEAEVKARGVPEPGQKFQAPLEELEPKSCDEMKEILRKIINCIITCL